MVEFLLIIIAALLALPFLGVILAVLGALGRGAIALGLVAIAVVGLASLF